MKSIKIYAHVTFGSLSLSDSFSLSLGRLMKIYSKTFQHTLDEIVNATPLAH